MADTGYAKQQQISGERIQAVPFRLGTEEYGVDIARVQEIIRMNDITHMPRALRKVGDRLIIMVDLTMVITSDDKRDFESLDAQLTVSS